ncbi:MAG: LamG domain-containing protein, partial [Bacilli bacterium]|nr:LamG domain-containing protein [Bacilli bacterium]
DFTHKAIDDGEWHHIVFVSDFNNLNSDRITVSLYVDGILMDTLTEKHIASWENNGSDQNFGTGTKFILGGDNTSNMRIANLRIYDYRKLNAEQVKNIFNAKQ